MTTYVVGRGVRVEVQKTVAAGKAVSAITNAFPSILTSTAHGLANGSIGYLSGILGMVNIDQMAQRVANQAANTFELQSLDTTDFPAFSATGTPLFVPITAWDTIGIATGYNLGGGAADKLDSTVLLDDIKQSLPGYLAEQTVQVNVNAETFNSAAMITVENAARRALDTVFRVTLKDGSVRIWRGVPSLPGEDVQKGAIGTGSFSVSVRGFIIKAPA